MRQRSHASIRGVAPVCPTSARWPSTVNHGKESLLADLAAPDDRELLQAIADRADVLVENFRPGTLDGWGWGWDELHARNPALVYASITGFGHTGPEAWEGAYDVVIQAESGLMSVTGFPDGPPVLAGTSIADYLSGLNAFAAISAALVQSRATGEGSRIDIAMFDSLLAILGAHVFDYLATGAEPQRSGNANPLATPFDIYPAADGPIAVCAPLDPAFAALVTVLDRPELAEDPRFARLADRLAHREDAGSGDRGGAVRAHPGRGRPPGCSGQGSPPAWCGPCPRRSTRPRPTPGGWSSRSRAAPCASPATPSTWPPSTTTRAGRPRPTWASTPRPSGPSSWTGPEPVGRRTWDRDRDRGPCRRVPAHGGQEFERRIAAAFRGTGSGPPATVAWLGEVLGELTQATARAPGPATPASWATCWPGWPRSPTGSICRSRRRPPLRRRLPRCGTRPCACPDPTAATGCASSEQPRTVSGSPRGSVRRRR